MIGRAIQINGKPWTVLAKADWGDYYYLGNPEEDDPIIRSTKLVERAAELGLEVDPN